MPMTVNHPFGILHIGIDAVYPEIVLYHWCRALPHGPSPPLIVEQDIFFFREGESFVG